MSNMLLLLVWLVIGTGLRFTHLAAKPPWTDEFSTIVFGLGNSFRTVPLDRAIALDVLLQPLQPHFDAKITDVVRHLLRESNHPPLYFVLVHWWMWLFSPASGGLASVWAARSLSVLFGVLSIPAIYALSRLAFRSYLISQLAAAIMAVSPYGIFLAQEARHYTLAILWVIASLNCLTSATRRIQTQTSLPIWLAVSWISINFLGISTHYLFAITLCTEALWLIILSWRQTKRGLAPKQQDQTCRQWLPIYVVAISTAVGCLVWLPIFWQESDSELIGWIQSGDRSLLAWISPVSQALAAWITMLYLLPVEAPSLIVVIASGLAMLGFALWVLPILWRGFRTQLQQPTTSLMTQLFTWIVVGAVTLFFFFSYVLNIDLTRGARYNFVYFPAVIVLLGASLAVCWNQPKRQKLHTSGRTAVVLVWLIGLVSGLTVVSNLGYQKYYRPDLVVPLMQVSSPMLIATTHTTHVQVGEMMGLARVFKLSGSRVMPLFLLAHQNQNLNTPTDVLQHALTQLPQPLELWLVNFHAPVELDNCVAAPQSRLQVNGYDCQLYHCGPTQ